MTPSRIDIPYPIPVVIQQDKAQVMYPYASSFEQTAEKLENNRYQLFVIHY